MTFVSRDRALLRGEHGQKEPGALFVELRLAMRGVARNGNDRNDNDDDEDEDEDDDDDDDEETLLSIKMANYPTNKRRSSGTKRESCWATKPANSVSASPPAEGD